ncbi:hypothetical protein V1512DRAFT_260540 [Lipomyces arxii]|uniref:uncharacterized protein n=1 Tax=Lipomyces arxii TaxID=56418 RepID=UPI0034CDFCD0
MYRLQNFTARRFLQCAMPIGLRHSPVGYRLFSINSTDKLEQNVPSTDTNASPYKKITYEPPRLPPLPSSTVTQSTSSSTGGSGSSGNRRIFAIALSVAGTCWTVYVAKTHFFYDEVDPADDLAAPALDPNRFSTFIITHREEVGRDCVLLELAPPWQKVQHLQSARSRHMPEQDFRDPEHAGDPGVGNYWDGSRVWTVEVKQPDLQISRKYTPIPIHYELGLRTMADETDLDENGNPKMKIVRSALLRMEGLQNEVDEAKIVLFIRKYEDGEVSRWLYSLPVLSRVQLRGPHKELELPKPIQPRSILNLKRRYREHKAETTPPMRRPMLDNPSKMVPDFKPEAQDILFFAGGTGIAPALQLLLSKNPIPGKFILHYSVRDRKDIVCPRFLYFLERSGRAEIHYHIDNEGSFVKARDIPPPWTEASDTTQNWFGFKPKDVTWDLTQYASAVELHDAQIAKYKGRVPGKPTYAIVCGPEGYIDYIAGTRELTTETNDQGHVGGLLAQRGWTDKNVYKL